MQLDVKEVASHLDLSEREVYHLIDRNEIPCFRVNDRYRFNGAELLEWAAARQMRLHPHILCGDDAFQVSVCAALENGGIHHRFQCHDRDSFLQCLLALLPFHDRTDRDYAMRMIRSKPDLGLVSLGNGILGPHVRHSLVTEVESPMLFLCFSTAAMPLNITENGGHTAVFFLVAPDAHTHQRIVSKLAFLLEDEVLRRLLLEQAADQELMAAFEKAESELLS